MKRFSKLFGGVAILSVPLACGIISHGTSVAGHSSEDKTAPTSSPVSGTLLRTDFNTTSWPAVTSSVSPQTLSATVATSAVGTIDVANTAEPSGALLITARTGGKGEWNAALVSGLLPVRNAEKNLGKLTLSFDLSVSAVKPVVVRVESFGADNKRTGGLVGTVVPAAPDFFQRYALDLSTLKPEGPGKFDPKSPFVRFSFGGSGGGNDAAAGEYQVRLDNVNYATPAFYVSPKGSDKSDGRTEKTAFATPQKALDMAQPGDIVVLMDGKYEGGNAPVASFPRGGQTDAWIVLKNYPGHKPLLTSTGWNIVSIAHGSKEKPSDAPALCYLEVRGLHVRGEGDVAKTKYPDAMNQPDSRTNSNGIAVNGRFAKNIMHHIRFADNLVEYCPGQGLGELEADWVTIENNVSRYNCWTTIYGTSGISTLGASNFDTTDNVYKILIRNNISYGNEIREICTSVGRLTDGNGIILDVNQRTSTNLNSTYRGRTLVQNNLCFNNGGSGIHTVRANRVDIVGNTAHLNSASKGLEYSQIYTYGSEDVRILNNILVAPVADVAAGEKPEPVNRLSGKNKDVVFAHNLYYGGNIAPTLGEGDEIGDPRFVKPTRDGKAVGFRLQTGSPAIARGKKVDFAPYLDLDGKPRRTGAPTLGAYEK